MTNFWGLDGTGWAALTALGTFGLVLVASTAALAAFSQVSESRRIRQEQTRPYVVVSVEPSLASRQLLDVVIRNVGTTPAIGTRIKIEPPLRRAREDDQFPIAAARVFTKPIALIAPGYSMNLFLDNGIERKDRDDLPDTHTATVTYTDSTGVRWTDVYTLDVAAQRGASWVGVLGGHDAAEALQRISEAITKSPLLTGEVGAVVETRGGQRRRLARERHAARVGHDRLVDMLGGASPTDTPLRKIRRDRMTDRARSAISAARMSLRPHA